MSTIIEGVLKGYLNQETGTGQNGPWYKQPVLIEQGGQYPKTVCVDFWNDKIEMLRKPENAVGSYVRVSVNAESRPNKEGTRYFTELRAWKIEPAQAANVGAPAPAQYNPVAAPQQAPPQPQYTVGQIVNGHRFTGAGWEPVPATPPPATPQPPAGGHFAPPSQQPAFQQPAPTQAAPPQASAPPSPHVNAGADPNFFTSSETPYMPF